MNSTINRTRPDYWAVFGSLLACLFAIATSGCVTVHYQKGDESLNITSVFKKLDGASAKRGEFTLTLGATGTTMSLEEMLKIAALLSPGIK